MKKTIIPFLILAIIFNFAACTNELDEVEVDKNQNVSTGRNLIEKRLLNVLLEVTDDTQMIQEVYDYVDESLQYGLDETAFIDEIVNPDKYGTELRSSKLSKLSIYLSNNMNSSLRSVGEESFSIDQMEIYWPYSENWDGTSIPIVTYRSESEEYIDGDKVWAYKYIPLDNGDYEIDSLLIDENYAMENPVWVIGKKTIDTDELVKLKKDNSSSSYIPRDKNLVALRSTSNNVVAETKVTTIQSTKQHDDWLNGGSEYVISWFFPTAGFGIAEHKTSQIKLARDEISKKKTREINFVGNYDWEKGQQHNRLRIIEFDPGKNRELTIEMSTSYKPKDSDTTLTGKFTTKTTINKTDDFIMEHTIARTAMFTTETRVNDSLFQKSFTGSGVTVNVAIRGINGVIGF